LLLDCPTFSTGLLKNDFALGKGEKPSRVNGALSELL
jgi:hypothetical protein